MPVEDGRERPYGGPVGAKRREGEAVPFDQPARDRGVSPIELGCAMARLAAQHDAPVAETVEQACERRIIEVRTARPGATRSGNIPIWPAGLPPVLGPAVLADQRHEPDGAKILLGEFGHAAARDLEQLLLALAPPDRDDQPAADRELLLQRVRHGRSAGGHQDRVERRGLRPAERAVTDTQLDVVVSEFAEPLARALGERGMALDA